MIDWSTRWNDLCQTARLKFTKAFFFSSFGSSEISTKVHIDEEIKKGNSYYW